MTYEELKNKRIGDIIGMTAIYRDLTTGKIDTGKIIGVSKFGLKVESGKFIERLILFTEVVEIR